LTCIVHRLSSDECLASEKEGSDSRRLLASLAQQGCIEVGSPQAHDVTVDSDNVDATPVETGRTPGEAERSQLGDLIRTPPPEESLAGRFWAWLIDEP